MTRILVTGGSGRLGRSIVTGFVAAGHDVVSVDRTRPSDPAPAVEYREVDLTDAEATQAMFAAAAPDAIVSLAAIAVPFSAPEDVILATNSAIAHNVAAAAVAVGAGRVVIASSPTVMGYGAPAGWQPEELPLDEDARPRPWHAYGLSKLVAEQVSAMFAARYGDAVRFASFRPCYVIAPEEWAGTPTQQGHTVAERLADPALAAPSLFNYVDARDVTDFLLLLLDKMDEIENGETFFVGAADALATRPLAELLPEYDPNLGQVAARLSGRAPAFSIEKARRVLGWEPRRTWRTELEDPPHAQSGR